MQGTNVDLVMLSLLILFFGLQQRSHPQRYFRFWFIGWIFVFLGYAVWAAGIAAPPLQYLQSIACFDFILLGILTFLMSVVATEPSLKKMVLNGSVVGLASVIVLDVQECTQVPKWLLLLIIVLWHADGLYIANKLLPKHWGRRRAAIFGICLVYGAGLLVYVGTTRSNNLDAGTAVEVLLCTAVLYAGMAVRDGINGAPRRRTIVGWMGTIGFGLWAGFYLINLWVGPSETQRVLYEFWNFPKYFVGFSMILNVFEEATDEKARLAEGFRELYEDFRLIYNTHPHPMWICDGVRGKFLTANEAALDDYGYELGELVAMRLEELEAPVSTEGAESEEVDSVMTLPTEGTRVRHRYKDGRVVWVNVVVREMIYLGQKAQFVIARDITERMKLDQELSFRAQHDSLTGLPNRQAMDDRLAQRLVECEREEKKATLLTIDVDHFKQINDTYGHLVGDECLKVVASRLKSRIRKVDTIARTGGEEFMAIVGGLTHASDAEKVAMNLLRVFEAPMDVSVGELTVTVSIGVAVFPDDARDIETLRRLSDDALYRAKRAGRNRAAYAYDVPLSLPMEELSMVERMGGSGHR